jgi:hypothetical protein
MATMPITMVSLTQTSALTADELRAIREYDRIVQFRDSILAGKHPRIKVPAQSSGKFQSSQQVARELPAAAASHASNDYRLDNLHSFKVNSQQPAVVVSNVASSTSTSGIPKPFGSGATQIDPLLLTKSDELIKAELNLRRQRLERSLREELDERRVANKAALQAAEQAADFDLSDILAKALTLVQATAPPPLPANAHVAANASDSSDSFDENTFYSSQHDTPEPSPQPQAHKASGDTQMLEASSSRTRPDGPAASELSTQPKLAPSPFPPTGNRHPTVQASRTASSTMPFHTNNNSAGFAAVGAYNTTSYLPYHGEVSLTEQTRPTGETHPQIISSNGSGTTSRSDTSRNANSALRADHTPLQASLQLIPSNQYGYREPLIRAHDLEPIAPQPAHVSPLATARQPPIPDSEISILQGTPAQVATLRHEVGTGTSPESSGHGERGGKKKNKKKNKRREARGAEIPASPYIKPEPQSPSPLSAPQFTRPHKRQRQANRSQHELNYDEPRAGQPVEIIHDDYSPRQFREERVPAPVVYGRVDDTYPRHVRQSIAPAAPRIERPVYEERRPEEAIQYARHVPSPAGYTTQYAPGETRAMRSATYSVADPIFREAPPYHHPEGRMSVRPLADRARSRSPVVELRSSTMAPPRPPPRIVRDQFGREYLEPGPPPPALRQSAVPVGRPAEHELIYERAPVRAASRIPGPETFERDGVIYRRASPAPAPRRVITEPDYGAIDYRGYRQRDYSIQPIPTPVQAPAQEFVQYRGDGRVPQEMALDYGMRAASVRPAEHIRYEYPRIASVRPELQAREYASVHPEARREVAPVYREYSVRPAAEPELPRREFSVRPVERYYDRPVVHDDEVQFIERPRTVQREIIYDDGRRELYR